MRSLPLVWIFLCLLAVPALSGSVDPAETFLQNYRSPDGAVTLQPDGEYVDPYFATKALLVGQDAGLDVRVQAGSWIKWALAHQRSDGRFDRYCRKPGAEWRPCAPADADDAMLALWLQLLYRQAPDSGMPAPWQESVRRATAQLAKLRNGHLGLYYVSRQNHAPLLMDNVEIYSALNDVAAAQNRFGNHAAAQATHQDALNLAEAIRRLFWNQHAHWFRPSLQHTQPAFYPDVVAQIYPWLADLPASNDDHEDWESWKKKFASAWLETKYDPHPWGLVALAAAKEGDKSSAVCWLAHAQSLRYSSRWNVLEEAIYQGLESSLGQLQIADAAACSRVLP